MQRFCENRPFSKCFEVSQKNLKVSAVAYSNSIIEIKDDVNDLNTKDRVPILSFSAPKGGTELN